jgi:hypothetical protein
MGGPWMGRGWIKQMRGRRAFKIHEKLFTRDLAVASGMVIILG